MRCRRNQIHNSRAHRETLELEHSRRVILFKVSTCFECGSAWERQRHGITIECTYPKCVSLYVWHIEGVSLDACSSRCNVSASIQFSAAGKMIDDASYYQHRSGRVRRKCIDNKMQLNVGTVWNTRGSNFVCQEFYWFICGIYWFSRRLRGNLRVTVIIDHTEAINLHVFFCLLIQLAVNARAYDIHGSRNATHSNPDLFPVTKMHFICVELLVWCHVEWWCTCVSLCLPPGACAPEHQTLVYCQASMTPSETMCSNISSCFH